MTTATFRWWEIEDLGGWAPWMPPPRIDGERVSTANPWPANWDRRPHP